VKELANVREKTSEYNFNRPDLYAFEEQRARDNDALKWKIIKKKENDGDQMTIDNVIDHYYLIKMKLNSFYRNLARE
jgi:hypothetical protein